MNTIIDLVHLGGYYLLDLKKILKSEVISNILGNFPCTTLKI